MKKRVLIISSVENDSTFTDTFRKADWEVSSLLNGSAIRAHIDPFSRSLVLIDISSQTVRTMEVVAQLMAQPYIERIPIVLYGLSFDEQLIEAGIYAGIADFIVGPVPQSEVELRCRLRLARDAKPLEPVEKITRGNLSVDPALCTLSISEAGVRSEYSFTRIQFAIVYYLFQHHGMRVSRTDLAALWPDKQMADTTINVHVHTIRQRLGKHGHLISTKSRGFIIFEAEHAADSAGA